MRTRGDCGKNCLDCVLFRNYCLGCITRICLVAKCKRGTSHVGITYPKEFCRLREYCRTVTHSLPHYVAEVAPNPKARSDVSLPRFVPVVSLTDERTWFWHEIQHAWIIARMAELVKNKSLAWKVSSQGLHDFLGFEGKILLSTVMEDELLDKLTLKDYAEIVAAARPDATMVPDVYTYLDDPLCLSWQQTIKSANLAKAFSGFDVPVVGLVKGAIGKQVAWSTQNIVALGYQTAALPCRELVRLDLLDGMLMGIVGILRKRTREPRLLLYGLSYPLGKYQRELSYSGFSWFINAKRGLYQKQGNVRFLTDTTVRFEECGCVACKGKIALDLREDVKTLALHNPSADNWEARVDGIGKAGVPIRRQIRTWWTS